MDAELVRLSGGVFEIYRNGEAVYSKKGTGKFPAEREVVTLLRELEAGKTLAEARATFAASKPQGGFLKRLLGAR